MPFDSSPTAASRSTVFIKTLIGLVTGIIVSILIFVVLILVGWVIQEALTNTLTWTWQANPLLSLILISISFVGTFVGCFILTGIYNVLYTDKYYDMSKMLSLILFANIILFVLFAGLYLVFASSITTLFFVLAAHIIFTVFICYTLVEISTNPNYAAVHLIWGAIGLSAAFFLLSLAYTRMDVSSWNTISYLLSLPPVLIFISLPFRHGLWEKIYAVMYDNWYNIFYIPSLSDVLVDEEENEEVTVSME